jgi:hypothetical protein
MKKHLHPKHDKISLFNLWTRQGRAKKKYIQFATIYHVHNQGPPMIDFEGFKEFFQILKVKI